MNTYTIHNRQSGQHLGDYQADTTIQALDLMAQDAGYKDYEDLLEQVPDASIKDLIIEPKTGFQNI